MLKSLLAAVPFFAVLALAPAASAVDNKEKGVGPLQYVVKDIDGKDVDLAQYKGKVVMIVNVASKCGNTPQYKALEESYKKYGDKGFVVLGFPANEFRGQEPGTNADIKEFCTSKFGVTFPMFSKVVVKGDGQADLYRHLTSKETNPKAPGPITWNFEKFLIGRDGKIAGRFKSDVEPTSEELTKAIQRELAKKP